MKKCSECRGQMKELVNKTPEGIGYKYHKCVKCGEEIVDMDQLHNVAKKYRLMKSYHVKLSKWGLSVGMRLPKEIVERYNFLSNKEVVIIPDKQGIKVIPA